MPPAPPSDRELDAYREQADRFIAELDEEFYLHYAGLKETFDLAPIYERHKNLTELDQVKSIGLAVNGGARVRELWRFACEGYFGELTRDHAEKLAELESELAVSVGGEEIPYRMVRPALANEPDREKRRVDRKSTRLNSSHVANSYAVFCLKKKTTASAMDCVSGTRRSHMAALAPPGSTAWFRHSKTIASRDYCSPMPITAKAALTLALPCP